MPLRIICLIACAIFIAGCVAPQPRPEAHLWTAPTGQNHPLVGRIFRTETRQELSPEQTIQAAIEHDVVYIGERHDNPDQHMIQAWIVDQMGASGRRPLVVMEMITKDQWGELQDYFNRYSRDMSGLGRALDWEKRGWPAWEMYMGIAEAVARHDLSIQPGNPSKNTEKRARKFSFEDTLSPTMLAETGLLWPLPKDEQQELEQDLIKSHCGMLRSQQAQKFAKIQRLRDGFLAARAAMGEDGAIVIAGLEHTRTDRGSPYNLMKAAPGVSALSIGLIETNPAQLDIHDFASLPFDIVWFTPSMPEVDMCAHIKAIRTQLRENGTHGDKK